MKISVAIGPSWEAQGAKFADQPMALRNTATDMHLVLIVGAMAENAVEILGWLMNVAGAICLWLAMDNMHGHWGDFFGTMSGDKLAPPPVPVVLFLVIGSLLLAGGLRLTGHLGQQEPAEVEEVPAVQPEHPKAEQVRPSPQDEESEAVPEE